MLLASRIRQSLNPTNQGSDSVLNLDLLDCPDYLISIPDHLIATDILLAFRIRQFLNPINQGSDSV